MPAGRPRIPTALKIIQGNRGKRALPANEPKPERHIPPAPKFLNKTAKKFYRKVAKYLDQLGLMADLYGTYLAAASQAYAKWAEVSIKLETEPDYFKTPQGYPTPNPLLRIQARALEQLKSFGNEFGMSPVQMTKIAGGANPDQQKPADSPARKYF